MRRPFPRRHDDGVHADRKERSEIAPRRRSAVRIRRRKSLRRARSSSRTSPPASPPQTGGESRPARNGGEAFRVDAVFLAEHRSELLESHARSNLDPLDRRGSRQLAPRGRGEPARVAGQVAQTSPDELEPEDRDQDRTEHDREEPSRLAPASSQGERPPVEAARGARTDSPSELPGRLASRPALEELSNCGPETARDRGRTRGVEGLGGSGVGRAQRPAPRVSDRRAASRSRGTRPPPRHARRGRSPSTWLPSSYFPLVKPAATRAGMPR